MDLSTRVGRTQYAQRLLAELKSPRRASDDPQPEMPIGDCGRGVDDPRGCGMKDESECRTHCGPAPATLRRWAMPVRPLCAASS
jgi:hypothetical protein